jgi:hypothetical protein
MATYNSYKPNPGLVTNIIPTIATSKVDPVTPGDSIDPSDLVEPEVPTPEQIAQKESEKTAKEKRYEELRIVKESTDRQLAIVNSQLIASEGTPEYYTNLSAINKLNQFSIDSGRILALKDEKDEEDEDILTLEDLAMLTIALGQGVSLAESIDGIVNGDEIEKVNAIDQLTENVNAITNEENRQKIMNANFGDQAQLSDLENLSAYNNQFGSLSSDMFNGQYGQQLEASYQEFLKANPGIDRDQFLTEYARANPVSPISQEINARMSRMGQLTRGASEFGQIDRNTIVEGFQDASKFYKPTGQGGYGFKPTDFRSQEQNQVVNNALGLMNGPESQLLRRKAMERVEQGGQLGQGTLRDITANALTGVDPSLQAQPYLRTGGLAKSILNTEEAQRKRQFENENSLYTILQGDRAYAPAVSGVVNTGNVDPVNALGLAGKNSSTNANNAYITNPTTGLNYDPTSSYFGSVGAQNTNIDIANSTQPGMGQNITDLGQKGLNLKTTLDNLKT